MSGLNSSRMIFDKTLKYDITVMILFCIIGVIIKSFFGVQSSEDGITGTANATIWGYGLISISLLTITFITFALVNKLSNIENYNVSNFIKNLLLHSFSPLILFIILVWIISLNVKYFTIINKSTLPTEFTFISNMSTMMIIIQLVFIFKYIFDMITKTEFRPGLKPCGILYPKTTIAIMISIFLGLISFILTTIMNIILAFFITDG